MMRYGLPGYRLPVDVLEREIGEILATGVEFVPNKVLGRDMTLGDLRQQGFEAVFLALGASVSRRIQIEGGDHP